MIRKLLLVPAALAALVATGAHAQSLDGVAIRGQFEAFNKPWGPIQDVTKTVGDGVEFQLGSADVNDGQYFTADFSGSTVTVTMATGKNGEIHGYDEGWHFQLQNGAKFTGFTLLSSNFPQDTSHFTAVGDGTADWYVDSWGIFPPIEWDRQNQTYTATYSVTTAPVPEPATLAMMGMGLVFVAGVFGRRRPAN
jgi:hypothetical protein